MLDKTTTSVTTSPMDDFCPVCKTTRYMNKNLKFKVNNVCFHRACAACVDRIFSSGLAPCPVYKCPTKTLRKYQWRDQTFEDVAVEKEVDVRREIQQVFTKTEDDFETLRDYNNYLEQVEDIAFELSNGIDVEKNRAKIENYKRDHGDQIARKKAGSRKTDNLKATAGPMANANGSAGSGAASAFNMQGLRQKREPAPEDLVAYDPYGGVSYQQQFFVLGKEYNHPEIQHIQTNEKVSAGGYSFPEFYQRALCEAFSGLGVFVAEEQAGKDVGMPKLLETRKTSLTVESRPKKPAKTLASDDVF